MPSGVRFLQPASWPLACPWCLSRKPRIRLSRFLRIPSSAFWRYLKGWRLCVNSVWRTVAWPASFLVVARNFTGRIPGSSNTFNAGPGASTQRSRYPRLRSSWGSRGPWEPLPKMGYVGRMKNKMETIVYWGCL